MAENEWIRVAPKSPCPICGKADWCTRSADGLAVHCMRVESDKPSKGDSGGWIHQLGEPLPPATPVARKRLSRGEIHDLAKSMYEHRLAADTRAKLAVKLGVSVQALERLRVGYGCDHDGREYASFPSRSESGAVIGITRRYESGEKKTYPGTSNGLFFTPYWARDPGPVFIPEGASDVAAMLSAGLCAVGRPSNVGGVDLLLSLLSRRKGRRVVVVGERDERPERRGSIPSCSLTCKGCAHCFPGLHGAIQVSRQLRCEYIMPPTPFKDFREYWRSGGVWSEFIARCA